jgi:hypothetical protein
MAGIDSAALAAPKVNTRRETDLVMLISPSLGHPDNLVLRIFDTACSRTRLKIMLDTVSTLVMVLFYSFCVLKDNFPFYDTIMDKPICDRAVRARPSMFRAGIAERAAPNIARAE